MFILLFTIGIMLIIYSVLTLKKEKNTFQNIINNKSASLEPVNIEIGTLRREVGETLTEIQQDIIKLEEEIKDLKEFKSSLEKNNENNVLNLCYNDDSKNVKEDLSKQKNNKDNKNIKNNIKDTQTDEIGKLLKEGCSIDEVCKRCNIGKGEVLLIRDLYIN